MTMGTPFDRLPEYSPYGRPASEVDAELAKRLPKLIALQQEDWANKGFLKKNPKLRVQFDEALAREVPPEGLPSSDQVAAVYSIVGLRVASRMAKAPSTYEAAVSKVARCLWQMDPFPEAPAPFLRTFGLYPPRESSSLTERVGHDIATEVAKGYRARLLLASICSDSLDREALRRIGASTSTQDAEEDESHQIEMAWADAVRELTNAGVDKPQQFLESRVARLSP